jgi:hypothetical protein
MMLDAEMAWIEQELIKMPVGGTFCVHHSYSIPDLTQSVLSTRVEGHVILGSAICEMPVQKHQYGPKTPEIEAEIQQYMKEQEDATATKSP